MTSYPSARHVCTIETTALSGKYIRGIYELDTCHSTLKCAHVFCPNCGDIWAKRQVFALDPTDGNDPKKLPFCAQGKVCASCGDGSLYGVAPFPAFDDPQYRWWLLAPNEDLTYREVELELLRWLDRSKAEKAA